MHLQVLSVVTGYSEIHMVPVTATEQNAHEPLLYSLFIIYWIKYCTSNLCHELLQVWESMYY